MLALAPRAWYHALEEACSPVFWSILLIMHHPTSGCEPATAPLPSLQSCSPGDTADARLGSSRPASYFFVYPNIMINRYGPWLDTNIALPVRDNPGKCRVVFDWWLERSMLEKLVQEQQQQQEQQEEERQQLVRVVDVMGEVELSHRAAVSLPFVIESLRSSHQVQVCVCLGTAGKLRVQGGNPERSESGPLRNVLCTTTHHYALWAHFTVGHLPALS